MNPSAESHPKKGKPFPPCQVACPIHQDVRGYIAAIAQGDFGRAGGIITETNPLPFVCATICAHPCEKECRRKDVDQPLAIRSLKRAAMDFGEKAKAKMPLETPPDSTMVAVIGSGPAGLTASHDLALLGYRVTIFEKEAQTGGALVQFIPLFRLPRDLVWRDIDAISSLGVEFRTKAALGSDFTLVDLESQGYRTILLAMGLQQSMKIKLPGFDAPDIWMALPFLKEVNCNSLRIGKGKEVIVIGGGNVAMDAARSALRSGARGVRVVYRRSRDKMRAYPWEIEEALEEGIAIHCLRWPKAVLRKNGRVRGLESVVAESDEDLDVLEDGCAKGKTEIFEGDIIIVAIGQKSDTAYLKGSGIAIEERGGIFVDQDTLATSLTGVFACGELVTGPGMAAEAMASGRKAALAIHDYIQGLHGGISDEYHPLEPLEKEVIAAISRWERRQVPMVEAKERIMGFDAIELGYNKGASILEAHRCLSCGAGARRIEEKCIDCLTCVRICPYKVPVITPAPDNAVQIREEQCQACGICVVECPARAIEFNSPCFDAMDAELKKALPAKPAHERDSHVLLLFCSYGVAAITESPALMPDALPSGVRPLRVDCVAKLGVSFFLRTFELGAEGLLILECPDRDCIHAQASHWLERHIETTRRILSSLGLRQEQIGMMTLSRDQFQDPAERIQSYVQGIKHREVHP